VTIFGEEPRWRRYLRLFGSDARRDVDDELASHLAMRAEQYVAEGMAPAEARRRAREQMGSVAAARAACLAVAGRRRRGAARLERLGGLGRDARQALRAIRRRPRFAVAVILTLALGIGAATAMFSAVDAAFLRPLPFPAPGRLVLLHNINVPFAPNGAVAPSATPDLRAVAALPRVFSSVAAFATGGLNLRGAGPPIRVGVAEVTPSFFPTLGVQPALGRGFTAEEGRPGTDQVAVLSDGLWRRWFGGGRIIGRTIRLNGRARTVVGVMPRGFAFPDRAELWIPMTVPLTFASFEPFRGYLPSQTIARLAEGASLADATAQLRLLWSRVPPDMRPSFEETIADPVTPLQRTLVGDRRTPLLVLLGATALLLLIACANAANLLLTRASLRVREIGLRAVLGATRSRLVQQLVVEGLVLALAGAAAGLVIAALCLGIARTLLPEGLVAIAPPALDVRVFLFAAALATAAGLGSGIWPALGATRGAVHDAIKAGGGAATPRRGARIRRVLATTELALALTLVAGAGLMLRSFRALVDTDPGFHTGHVGTLQLAFPSDLGRAARLAVLEDVVGRLRAMPGVADAGVVNDLPLARRGGISIGFEPEGRPAPRGLPTHFARYLQATGGYFHTLGIPLLEGRLMTVADDSLAPPVVVINATMARQLWPGEDPIGRRIREAASVPALTVIGVVGDVHEGGLSSEPPPQMYLSLYADTPGNAAVVARGAVARRTLLGYLRDAVHAADSTQAFYDVRTMDDVLATSLVPQRANTELLTAFGALALALATLGVYGVIAFGVAQRGRELAIRTALGATRGDLVRLVAREGATMAAAGTIAGVAGAYAFSRVLASLLYGVAPTDPLIFVAAPCLLLAAVLAASIGPVRRAAQQNPVDAIRAE
jgi:putative ABC transport system permease protein